jgi:hypothetical protein
MTVKELEERVIALEQQVKRLTNEVEATRTKHTRNWRAAVEKYAGDEDLLSIFADAQKLREQDRQRTRGRSPSRRRPRS